jgi:predicted  nucleic acid-binding Zn ribbon protein
MYYYEITFTPTCDLRGEEELYGSRISWFLFLCRLSGQILGRHISREDKPFAYYVYTPEVDSLDERYDPSYVARDRAVVKEKFTISLTLLDSGEGQCRCDSRIGIEMRTDMGQIESPFCCLSCGKPIPLYRLPDFEDGSFQDTINWQDGFAAMLELNNTVLYDEFTSDQLLRYDSKLNEEGRKLAGRLAGRVDVPVYYRLYEIDETFKQQPRKNVNGTYIRICPICGKTMERMPVGGDEVIEICQECGLSSAEEIVEW